MSNDDMQRIAELRSLIAHHGYRYYTLDAPEILTPIRCFDE